MPSSGFEPAIPAVKWLQTYALDRTVTGIGKDGIRRLILAVTVDGIKILVYLSPSRSLLKWAIF
jgi:hypothetical protein